MKGHNVMFVFNLNIPTRNTIEINAFDKQRSSRKLL